MVTVYINGKFLGQPTTGAQRFAMGILLALDALLLHGNQTVKLFNFTLVVPSNIKSYIPTLKKIKIVKLSGSASHFWEQIKLPLYIKNSFLINLSGSAPIFKRNQFFTVFDAAIFDLPNAYSKKFLVWYKTQFRLQSIFSLGLITISKFSRNRLCKHLGVRHDKFLILHCGFDHIIKIKPDKSILNKYNLKRKKYLLAVGSKVSSKNFSFLTRAFLNLGNDFHISLVFVGGTNSDIFVDSEILENKRIMQLGRVNDAELKALYLNAIALVFPSLYEGFGIPPLEAMACGCPVVASNKTAIPEVCGNAVGYFDPMSLSSIQNSLEKIITDTKWRDSLRRAGIRKVAMYSWDKSAAKLMNHIQFNAKIFF